MLTDTFLMDVLEASSALIMDRSATKQTQTGTTFLFDIHLFNVIGHHLCNSSIDFGNVECFIL